MTTHSVTTVKMVKHGKGRQCGTFLRLAAVNTLVEFSGQYSLLAGAHYDVIQMLIAGNSCSMASETTVARLMVQQSIAAAVAEFMLQVRFYLTQQLLSIST